MARLQIIYDTSDDIEEILKSVEDHINLNSDEAIIFNMLQAKFQAAFDEGRKFERQMTQTSDFKNSLLYRAGI
jgi:hypothetical protein